MTISEQLIHLGAEDADTRRMAAATLLKAAEEGTDLTFAFPALAGRLADPDVAVRWYAAHLLAESAERGLDVRVALPALTTSLADSSDEVWSLVRRAIRATTQQPHTRAAAVASLEAGLDHPIDEVRAEAAYLLAVYTLLEPDGLKQVIGRVGVRVRARIYEGLAFPDGTASPPAIIALMSEGLAEDHPAIRQCVVHGLMDAGEAGADLSPALERLAAVLFDPEIEVRKGAIWALYLIALQGANLRAAADGLIYCLLDPDGGVRGNATIGLVLHLLNTGQAGDAEALLHHDTFEVRFGAGWGFMDYYVRQADQAALETLMYTEDHAIRKGITQALRYAMEYKRDIGVALVALQHAIARAEAEDPVKASQVFGIHWALHSRD